MRTAALDNTFAKSILIYFQNTRFKVHSKKVNKLNKLVGCAASVEARFFFFWCALSKQFGKTSISVRFGKLRFSRINFHLAAALFIAGIPPFGGAHIHFLRAPAQHVKDSYRIRSAVITPSKRGRVASTNPVPIKPTMQVTHTHRTVE